MYNFESSANTPNQTGEQTTGFNQIIHALECESSRAFNLSNELLRKADGILRFPNDEQTPDQKSPEPKDFISKCQYELNVISRQNDKLQYLLDHLNKII